MFAATSGCHRIARKGIESSIRLGRHRWTIERTVSAGCSRPPPPLRTQSRTPPGLRRHRLHPHLLAQTHHAVGEQVPHGPNRCSALAKEPVRPVVSARSASRRDPPWLTTP